MKSSISVSCEKKNLQQIREFIIDVLNKQHLPEIEVHSMVLAVDEVCANLMIHSKKSAKSHSIEVDIIINGKERVVFEIMDRGRGFDLRKYPEPDLKEIIKQKRKGGVGLLLVKRIMDEIDFIDKKDYHIVRLIKNL